MVIAYTAERDFALKVGRSNRIGTEGISMTKSFSSKDQSTLEDAKLALRNRLQDTLEDTADACYTKLEGIGSPWLIGESEPGDIIVRESSLLLKQKLPECVRDEFEWFVAVAQELHQGEGGAPADRAVQSVWETLDQFFTWTPDDRNNSSKCKEWLSRATYPVPPEYSSAPNASTTPWEYFWQSATADCLNDELLLRFKECLNALRAKAASMASVVQSTKSDTSASRIAGIDSIFQHSPDFRSVTVQGQTYTLTPHAACFVKTLYESLCKGLEAVSTNELLASIKSPQSRVRDSLKNPRTKQFWKRYVVEIEKGMYRLELRLK